MMGSSAHLGRTLLLFATLGATVAGAQSETLGGPTRQEKELKSTGDGFVTTDEPTAEATILPPQLLTPSAAVYPEALREQPTPPGGTVKLQLLVDETGRVGEATVVEAAHPLLDAAALEAAKGLVFKPATRADEAVAVRIHYSYEFIPPQPPPPPGATISGEVRTKGTRRPIVGAAILLGEEGTPLAETAERGLFSAKLAVGTHVLKVTAPGHKEARLTETVISGQTLQVVYRLEPLVVDPYETIVRGQSERTEVSRITLAEQELREVPGTQGDPFRVVMLLPGVSSLASGLSYPVVRGAQPAATAYYLDGVRVPGLFHLLLGPAVVHPDFIDRIDFFAGAPPVRYGRLLGGVVEGYASRPREDRLHASAYADLINAGGFFEYPFQETGTHVTVSGRFGYTSLLATALARASTEPDAQGHRTDPIAEMYDYQARIEQKVGGGRLRLLGFGSSDVVGAESSNPDYGVDMRLRSQFHRVDLRHRQSFAFGDTEVGLTWGTETVGGEMSFGKAEVGTYRLRTNSVMGRAGWSHQPTPTLRLSAGVDIDHRRASTTLTAPAAASATKSESAFRQPLTLGTFSGVYAEATWRPLEPLGVTGGLRVDNYHLSPGLDFVGVDPRVSVRYQLRDNLVLKAGGGILHQPPSVLITLPVMDVAGLRYGLQEAATADLGAEWRPLDGFEVSIDAYYTHYFKALEFDLAQVFQEGRRRGVLGEDVATWGRSYGLELMVRHPLGQRWFGWVSYALQRSERYQRYARFDDAGNFTEFGEGLLPFAFDQTHVFNAAASYQFDGDWTVGAVVHFNTGRPESGQIASRTARRYTDPATGAEEWRTVGRDRLDRLPPFFRVDLRASKRWTFNDFTLEAYLDVLNASLQREVLGYDYGYEFSSGPQAPDWIPPLEKRAIGIPLVLPMAGVKGVY